jgi:hypothetical protein
MIEVELTKHQVDLLFPAIKQAELAYSNLGKWKACQELNKLHTELYKQIFTYGQVDKDE